MDHQNAVRSTLCATATDVIFLDVKMESVKKLHRSRSYDYKPHDLDEEGLIQRSMAAVKTTPSVEIKTKMLIVSAISDSKKFLIETETTIELGAASAKSSRHSCATKFRMQISA